MSNSFCICIYSLCRAIFVWSWNENARTKQKHYTNGIRAIWLVYRTDTNARDFWLIKQTLGWKTFMPKNFPKINRYFALTSYSNTIGQSNNAFSTLGFVYHFNYDRKSIPITNLVWNFAYNVFVNPSGLFYRPKW